jgi:hypothetical protein
MKRFIATMMILAPLVLLSVLVSGASVDRPIGSVPSEAIVAARQGVDRFVGKATAEPARWGLDRSTDAERVVLGEGYRIAYIGRSAFTASNDASILSLEDRSLYPTCLFTIDLDGGSKSFVTVCRIGGGDYQFADFGGDATYFGIAREAFRKVAGDSVAPILMQFGGQYFMVLEKDGRESVLPVPFDAATATIVESGQGFVATSAVIERFKEENKANVEGTAGEASLDVWNQGSRKVTDSTPCMITLAVVGGICFLAYLAGTIVAFARNRRTRKRSRSCESSHVLS